MDKSRYKEYTAKAEKDFEMICRNCGECCGALDDPCQNLVRVNRGRYFCKDYSNRLGRQKTVSGYPFTCVEIREHIKNDSLRPDCSYRKALQTTEVLR